MTKDISNKNSSKKLFNRNYFLLWQGQFVSRIGSQVYLIALIIWIKDSTDSASLLGLMGFLGGLPAIFFSIIGGTFADRHSRKRIIIFSDVINGFLMLGLAYLFYAQTEAVSLIISYLIFATILTSILGSYFGPAISAAIPDIVHKEYLTSANSWSQGSQQIVAIFGLGLGGVLYTLIGAPLLVLINGITFLFSAFSETFIKIPQEMPEKEKNLKDQFKAFKSDTKIGFQYIWKHAGLKNLVLTSVLINFFSVPIALLLPFYVDTVLHVNDSWLGYLLAISAVGSLCGYLITGLFRFKPKTRLLIITLFIFIDGMFYILLGIFSSLSSTIIIIFMSGFVGGFVVVHIQTILQSSIESNIRGRVFGVIGTISGALIPIGMGLAGYVADITNKNVPMIYIVSGILIVIVSGFIIRNKDIKLFLKSDYLPSKNEKENDSNIQVNSKKQFPDKPMLNLFAMDYIKKMLNRKNNFK